MSLEAIPSVGYLQAAAAHGAHDGGIVDDPAGDAQLCGSQEQVTVRRSPGVRKDWVGFK